MEKYSLAVIMTVHNRRDNTIECLHHLFAQENIENISVNVFITDDGSTDGTAEAIKDQFPSVYILKGDGSLFWNRGMYVAWKEAAKINFDFYLWLNDDTMLFPFALSTLFFIEHKKGENVIVVGSICSPTDKNRVTYGGRNNNGLIHPNGEIKPTIAFNGNVVLIPRIVFQTIGLNDYYFRHAFGDSDYGLRANENGIEAFVTNVFIGTCERHDNSRKCWNPDFDIITRFKYLYSPLGFPPKEAFYYYRKHFGLLKATLTYCHCHLKTLFPYIKHSN